MRLWRRSFMWLLACSVAASVLYGTFFVPAPPPGPPYTTSCYDGDTCTLRGWTRPVRLARIDAPEMDGPCPSRAIAARDSLRAWVSRAQTVRVEPHGRGYYDRWIADLYLDGENAASRLLALGLVVRYGEDNCP